MDLKEELRAEREIQRKFLKSLLKLNKMGMVVRAMIRLQLEHLEDRIENGFPVYK